MKKLAAVFQQHMLAFVAVVTVVPLLVIFYLQYRSLRTQETTLALYRRDAMHQYLEAVTDQVRKYYSDLSERVLLVPGRAITHQQGGVIVDQPSRASSLAAVRGVAMHFAQQQAPGLQRFFVVVATEQQGRPSDEVFFYDAQQRAMVLEPNAPELRAIQVACSPYLIYIRSRAVILSMSASADRNPAYRFLVKPIVDEEQRIIAVAGAVLDQEWFKTQIVPPTIQTLLPKFFPTEQQDAIVTLGLSDFSSPTESLLFSTQPTDVVSKEARMQFPFGFSRYYLGIRMRSATIEQWTRRNLLVNFVLWSAMGLMLVVGIALALRTAARERKLSQMKTDFLANVSHELRTPLASLLIFSELLRLGRVLEPEKVQEYGQRLEAIGQRLAQVINNILDFSRLEAGRKPLRLVPSDVRTVVEEALESCAAQLKQGAHAVQLAAPDALPSVLLDAGAIQLVLTNLLDNAIKYSAPGTPLHLALGTANSFVTIALTDHGMGIARAEQRRIFEKFYRVSTGMVHDVKGSGLGLAIAQHLVAAHGGHITVNSALGQGSTFTIYLPLHTEATAVPDDEAADSPAKINWQMKSE